MFGFGRKKRSLHLLYLQTVAASHSMRVSFQEIWNNNCIHAGINTLSRGDEDLVYIFDIYNRWMNSLFNERRGFGRDLLCRRDVVDFHDENRVEESMVVAGGVGLRNRVLRTSCCDE